MVKNKKFEFEFSNKIIGSTLPTDTFLETLRTNLSNNAILCSQTKERTGEAQTVGVGVASNGGLGGVVAHSDIITNKWNPFEIAIGSKKYPFLGKFEGTIKVTEMAKYQTKKKNNSYELKDYNINGGLGFSPSRFLMFILFCLGVYLGFKFSMGFMGGVMLSIGLPLIFFSIAEKLGNGEIDLPKLKISDSISNFEKYLENHNKITMK